MSARLPILVPGATPRSTELADKARRGEQVTVDVVIAGSGAGGAAAARTLARAGLKVLVLEEGGRHGGPQFTGKDMPWSLRNLYRDRGLQVFEGSVIAPLPAGRVVGGSTVINSGICFRAPDARLTEWRETAGIRWLTTERMKALYDEVEATIGVVETHPGIARQNNLVFLRGAERLGLTRGFIRRNAPGCTGCGVCHMGCPSGGKWSVDKNFLSQAEDAGAEVLPRARVAGLRVESGRCTGVNVDLLDENHNVVGNAAITAGRTILSSGSIGTPLILLRSDVGTKSGHVGQHLSMHPGVTGVALYDEEIKPWSGVPQGAFAELPDNPNVLLETFNVSLDLYYQLIGFAGPQGLARMKQANHLGSAGGMLRDRSVGSVGLGDGWRARIRYTLHDDDRRNGIHGMRWLCKLHFAAGAREVLPGRKGADFVKTEAEALGALTDDMQATDFLQLYASHPMGTCRMNADPGQGVVDPEGRVHGVKDLYVMDASIFPSSLGVNPQMTVMAMAMHLAGGLTRA
ncbi:MAG: GMC family oxidoreductase [Myxococcota bacterium]